MKDLIKILSILISGAFLLSTTGLFFIHHSCMHSGYEKIVISDKFDCCASETENSDCCGSYDNSTDINKNVNADSQFNNPENHKNCCINKFYYLKNDYQFTSHEKTIVKIQLFRTFVTDYHIKSLFAEALFKQFSFKSPTALPDIEILKLTGKLLL
ncbi:MAG: hypothetical protein JXB17_01360 [Bacteroidales bacterium]|nr:hypothetical protein [Bacteroidales bacterium]